LDNPNARLPRPEARCSSTRDRAGTNSSDPIAFGCASTFVKSEPTDDVFGVWMGTPSAANGGLPWWHILWDAARVPVAGLRRVPVSA
jgi:hypothetical protein